MFSTFYIWLMFCVICVALVLFCSIVIHLNYPAQPYIPKGVIIISGMFLNCNNY